MFRESPELSTPTDIRLEVAHELPEGLQGCLSVCKAKGNPFFIQPSSKAPVRQKGKRNFLQTHWNRASSKKMNIKQHLKVTAAAA